MWILLKANGERSFTDFSFLLNVYTNTKKKEVFYVYVTFRKLPVPDPSLHIVQIASYEEMNTIVRRITIKFTKLGFVSLCSKQQPGCERSPKFHTNVCNSEMASPNSIQSL